MEDVWRIKTVGLLKLAGAPPARSSTRRRFAHGLRGWSARNELLLFCSGPFVSQEVVETEGAILEMGRLHGRYVLSR
jgi:hypothetical protein